MLDIKSSYIYLREVRFHAFHGVMPQERTVGADFTVSLRIGCDISRAMLTDDVTQTISYADVFSIVKKEMGIPSKLLENVAERIAGHLFEAFPCMTSLDMSITKLNPPMGADSLGAGVEIHLINNKTI